MLGLGIGSERVRSSRRQAKYVSVSTGTIQFYGREYPVSPYNFRYKCDEKIIIEPMI